MNNEEIQKLVDLIKSPVKDIRTNTEKNITEIEFEDGTIIPVYGSPKEIQVNVKFCNHCGNNSLDVKLFTQDDLNYICSSCATLAVETFLKNGETINLNLGDAFPELQEILKKVTENFKSQEPLK